MLRTLWSSRAAMNAQQQKLDSISNNMANTNTVGYKREDVSFQDLVYENLNRRGIPTGGNNTDTLINGTGVKATKWIRDNSQGDLKETGLKTDLALDGQGFFRVTLPDGSKAYERSGSFNIDSTGEIVDKNGNRLDIDLTEEGTNMLDLGVVFTTDNFSVNEDGEIYLAVDNNGLKSDVLYGKINIYNSVGQDSLRSIGENLYVANPGAAVNATTDVSIMQGFVEGSNVDIGKEMTDMIVAQRAFELSSRTLKTADEMWGLVNSMKGR